MLQVPTVESETSRPFTKTAGTEPLPGYKLLEPLGRGGFGEVWKCEAPGGLLKAVKFVSGAETGDGQGERRLSQELDAFQQIKSIRHPFLLTLERVEVIDDDLVMVMELADRQLQDRFRECRGCGLPGIPRDELLAYFADAAEALDMIAGKFGLQHLDVKPANLFIVAGHVKVGDYGLVARLDPDAVRTGQRGLTPKYVAPECLRGEPSSRSDQYSLALVYQELLSGTFAYPGKTAQQLMLQHVSAAPDLSGLPEVDRPIVAQALAKLPEDRFGSSLGFVQALMTAATAASLPGARMAVRRIRVERSMADMNLPTAAPFDVPDAADPTGPPRASEVTHSVTLPGRPARTLTARPPGSDPLPRLVNTRPSHPAPKPPVITPAPLSTYVEADGRRVSARFAVVLDPIRSMVSVSRLLGLAADDAVPPAAEFSRAVVEFAAAGSHVPQMAGDLGRRPDGTYFCQFPSTVSAQVAPLKLIVLREQWGVAIDQPEPNRIVLRQSAAGGWFGRGGKAGFEVVVTLPPAGRPVGEVTVVGAVFGTPDREFARKAAEIIPRIVADVRHELKNVEDRRKHHRVAAEFGATLYPIHSSGGIDTPVHARCRDMSFGGIAVATESPLPAKYAYAAFDDILATAGYAILVRFIRSQPEGKEIISGGHYRADL